MARGLRGRHGFRLRFEHRDEALAPIAYEVDYLTMDPAWPVEGLAADERHAVLAKMEALAEGMV